MEPYVVGLLGFAAMLVLIVGGIPIAMTMLIVSVAGFFAVGGPTHAERQLTLVFTEQGSNFVMVALPLYFLMGQLVFRTRIAEDLYDCVYRWLGRMPGGLAVSSVVACSGFAAVSGGSVTAVATMGPMCMPNMRRYGYDDALATGAISAAGTLGILIPPSIILVVYGLWTETSIGALFIAGIVPGIILTAAFAAMVWIRCMLRPELGPVGEKFSWNERLRSTTKLLPVFFTFVAVIGGIYGGIVTPTEAAAVGVAALLLIALAMRRITWPVLGRCLVDTMHTTGMIFLIIVGGHMMGRFVVLTDLTSGPVAAIGAMEIHPLLVMALISVIYLLLGMMLDAYGMLILTIPFVFPIILDLGFDPVWFGIYAVLMCEIALITPPVGINVYVMAKVQPDVPLTTIFKGIVPFFFTTLLVVVLLTVFPEIVMWLPSTAFGR